MTLRDPMRDPVCDWPADLASRRRAQALLRALDAELRGHDSATLTLERWCAAHGLASPARVVADRVHGAAQVPDAAVRALLGPGLVRHRRVRLRCGGVVLSEAENWYLPRLLTPGMNAALDETDASFGHVVAPFGFRRHTLSAETLWHPLPDDPLVAPGRAGTMAVPPTVLRHRAVLRLADGTAFSVVAESYTGGVLAAAPGRAAP